MPYTSASLCSKTPQKQWVIYTYLLCFSSPGSECSSPRYLLGLFLIWLHGKSSAWPSFSTEYRDHLLGSVPLLLLSHSAVLTLFWPHGLCPARFLCPWDFSRQEYWSGLPFPSPGESSRPRDWTVISASSALQVGSLLLRYQGSLRH